MVQVANATQLTLGGPLLQLTGASTLTVSGDVLNAGAGAQVTAAPGGGLIDLTSTSAQAWSSPTHSWISPDRV